MHILPHTNLDYSQVIHGYSQLNQIDSINQSRKTNGGDGRHGRCCTCPKRKNVLQDGKIVRVVGEENKPVLRYSDFIAGMGPESSE